MLEFDYSGLLCHRRPDRSFFYKGHQFPVCARCTGFYISVFAYIIFAYLFPINYTINTFYLGILLLFPVFIDGYTQFLELRESTNYLRLLTGLMGGIGLMIIIKMIKFALFNNL